MGLAAAGCCWLATQAIFVVQDIMIQQAKVGLTGSDKSSLTTAQHLLAGSLAGVLAPHNVPHASGQQLIPLVSLMAVRMPLTQPVALP